MTFSNSQARDDHGRWTSGGSSSGAGEAHQWSTAGKIAAGVAGVAATVAAVAVLAPMASRALGSLATSTGIGIVKELAGAVVGGGAARAVVSRAVGARLGSVAGIPGAIAGALLAPAVEGAITSALTPRPEIAGAVIMAYPRLMQRLLTGK